MAVKLRLRREGTVKRPHYRIVAADSRSPRDGRFIESIGHYHPLDEPSTIEVDNERALHWLRNGALATQAVEKLFRISGVWEEFKPGDAPAVCVVSGRRCRRRRAPVPLRPPRPLLLPRPPRRSPPLRLTPAADAAAEGRRLPRSRREGPRRARLHREGARRSSR
jgi:ribosomal protein S16